MNLPDDNPSMWGQLEHAGQTYPSDDRPDPADLLDGPNLSPLWPAPAPKPQQWSDPLCPRCERNELDWWDHCCKECADDLLAEEAHDRGRAGEWDD
jgi:hypothetical protein